jgi:hypothetical protein
MTITAENVRELFHYDPFTGQLVWKVRPSFRVRYIGAEVGWIGDNGYRRMEFKCQPYFVHRVIWLWMTGEWPKHDVDHRDLNRANNKWKNLREATRAQNAWNVRPRKIHKGVYRQKNKGKRLWVARIIANGATYHLGNFTSKEEAAVAYQEAAADLHGEFARTK